jgi:hypothetical protein
MFSRVWQKQNVQLSYHGGIINNTSMVVRMCYELQPVTKCPRAKDSTSSPQSRVLARIQFKCPKKHVATTMTHRLGEIFLVKCQIQAFSFNIREAKVYCYAFLHVLKRDAFIKHEKFQYCVNPCDFFKGLAKVLIFYIFPLFI